MTECACRLPIVRLRRLNGTETRTTAFDVNDQTRKVGACDVGDTLALERNARRRRTRHDTCTSGGCAVHHIDGSDFAFRLQIGAALFGHALGHVGCKLGLRGDRVTEEESATCADGALGDGLVALHEYFLCHVSHLQTVIATSGHITAHVAQPVHWL